MTSSAPTTTAVAAVAGGRTRRSRYRFVVLGVVWSAYLIVFLSRLCVGPLAPFLTSAFDHVPAWRSQAASAVVSPVLLASVCEHPRP